MNPNDAIRVLDASAVLALLQEEPGSDAVEAALDDAAMSCVTLSEVLQKVEQHGIESGGLESDLEALGIRLHDFDARAARATAELWPAGTSIGLSLGDRACLALARMLGGVAVTADAAWSELDLNDVTIDVVR